jgi:hypothetical protein
MNKKKYKALLLTSLILCASSCSLMLPSRSFVDEMDRESDSYFSAGRDFPIVGGDSGDSRRSQEEILARTPSSERTKRNLLESQSLSQELYDRESSLEEKELENYTRDKKFLQTASDKLYYLSLSGYERTNYIDMKKGDLKDDLSTNRNVLSKRGIHSSELFLGMEKAEVVSRWGKPARVEISGNPHNQNERWSFMEDGSLKQVYFEDGKVQGWALDL